LLVTVVGDRIVLLSESLGKEIIPRLSNAHSFSHPVNLPVYRFLCLLQEEGTTPSVSWDWGVFSRAPYLPRVTNGRIVLSLRRWVLNRASIERVARKNSADGPDRFREYLSDLGLPRFIVCDDLLVDLENHTALGELLAEVRDRPISSISEMFPDPSQLCVRGPEGRYVHEIFVPFVRSVPTTAPSIRVSGQSSRTLDASSPPVDERGRMSFPGDEWLFAKIYAGEAFADHLLTTCLREFVGRLRERRWIESWFFLRYSDPHHHLRVRFKGDQETLWQIVLPELASSLRPFERDRLVWRFQLDTYDRELERYGGPKGLDLTERIFQIDSDTVLELLALSLEESPDLRWHLALVGADRLLGDFGLDLEHKRQLVGRMRDSRVPGGVEKADRILLGARYRQHRPRINALLDGTESDEGFEALRDVIDTRSHRIKPLVAAIRKLADQRELATDFHTIAGSCMHLFINRLLRSAQNTSEIVICDFLDRTYESRVARRGGSVG